VRSKILQTDILINSYKQVKEKKELPIRGYGEPESGGLSFCTVFSPTEKR